MVATLVAADPFPNWCRRLRRRVLLQAAQLTRGVAVAKGNAQALDVFLGANVPTPSEQAKPRASTQRTNSNNRSSTEESSTHVECAKRSIGSRGDNNRREILSGERPCAPVSWPGAYGRCPDVRPTNLFLAFYKSRRVKPLPICDVNLGGDAWVSSKMTDRNLLVNVIPREDVFYWYICTAVDDATRVFQVPGID